MSTNYEEGASEKMQDVLYAITKAAGAYDQALNDVWDLYEKDEDASHAIGRLASAEERLDRLLQILVSRDPSLECSETAVVDVAR